MQKNTKERVNNFNEQLNRWEGKVVFNNKN